MDEPGGDDTAQAAATPEGSKGQVTNLQKKINDVNETNSYSKKIYDSLKKKRVRVFKNPSRNASTYMERLWNPGPTRGNVVMVLRLELLQY